MTKPQFIAHYFLQNKYSYTMAIATIFCVNWLQVEIPRYVQQAIDLLGDASSESQSVLATSVTLVIVFSVVMVGVRTLSRMFALNPGRKIEAAVKNDLFFKLNRLPNSFHQNFQSGKLISIINNDVNGVRLFYGTGFLQFINVLFALSLTPIWMWRISPSLTLYSVIPIILAFLVYRVGFKKLRKLFTKRQQRLQNLSEQLMNYLAGIDLIKNQSMGPWVTKEIADVNRLLLQTTMSIMRIQSFNTPLLDHANNLMKVIILALGGYYLTQQSLTLGEITAFLSYSVLLALPLMQLGRIAVVFQMAMASVDSVLPILNSEIPAQDVIEQKLNASNQKTQTLTVKNLTYQYPDADAPVLNNISFSLAPGKKLGVLGSIGSGKSTLVNCINHHLDIQAEQIFWGTDDVAHMPRQRWRGFIKTMTQEPYLFSDSIEQNIRFGSSQQEIAKPEIERVIELAQLNDDVSRFEQTDQTMVGEKGIMLSGGQKQRLSIARALLNPSALLIMDNVLSAVDYDTERKILKGLFERIREQSVLIVSHRISSLENMDEILVLEQGHVIARGTHNQLLETCDYYRDTWQLQQHEAQVVS